MIAVMSPTGLEPELAERRVRRRYAVISGLESADLIPQSTNAIHYCSAATDPTNADSARYIVPYEWYVPNPTSSKAEAPAYAVLLLWIDETKVAAHPIDRLAKLARPER